MYLRYGRYGAFCRSLTIAAVMAAPIGASADANLASILRKPAAPGMYLDKGRTEYALFSRLRLDSPASQRLTLRYAPMLNEHVQVGLDLSYQHNGGDNGAIGGIANYYLG